jgi:hypothetical protein
MVETPTGPTCYDLQRLPPRDFEALTFLLARSQHPGVVPVRSKDYGLDARLADPKGRTIRGWQAKRHQEISWPDCQYSVRRAMAFWRPPRITFTFAHDLSATEQEKFRARLIACFPEVLIDYWPEGELQRLMRDTRDGQRAAEWLFHHPGADYIAMARAYAVGGPLDDSRQAAERQALIQQYMDRDPHLHYTMISRNADGPHTDPAPETFLSVTLRFGDQEVRFDASERYPGALADLRGGPRLLVSDDEAGVTAQSVVERLGHDGGRTQIGTGLGLGMPVVPVGLRGLFPEEGLWGPMEVEAKTPDATGPAEVSAVAVLAVAGETELGMMLSEMEPPEDWLGTLAGGAGGLELFISTRGASEDEIELRLDWRHTRGEGTGLEQLLAARIMLAGLRGEPLTTAQSSCRARWSPPKPSPTISSYSRSSQRSLDTSQRWRRGSGRLLSHRRALRRPMRRSSDGSCLWCASQSAALRGPVSNLPKEACCLRALGRGSSRSSDLSTPRSSVSRSTSGSSRSISRQVHSLWRATRWP